MRTLIKSFGSSSGALAVGALLVATLGACGQPTGGDECTDACITPPAPTCEGETLVSFALLGECVDGTCRYTPTTTTCAHGCSDGSCDAAPICGVDCAERASMCDDQTAVRYERAGCDENGECAYNETREDCAAINRICDGGACIEPADPCEGVDCSVPPEAVCEGDTAVVYAGTTCADGACPWGEERTNCAERGRVCEDGACVSRCEDVVCDDAPAPWCDGLVAVRFGGSGQCDGTTGRCTYDEDARVPCDANLGGRCVAGACIEGRACSEGCDEPPAAFCSGDVAVRFDAGTCSGGVCSFAETTQDCAADGLACFDGVCALEEPCRDVTCDEPPAAFCDGNTLVSYDLAGTCRGGDCRYEPLRTSCGELGGICLDGVCRTDLCEGVECPEPPAPTCIGAVAVTRAEGVCQPSGECTFGTTRVDCSVSGQGCVDGACVDLCEGVECDATPAPYCAGSVAVVPSGPGTCASGTCQYTEERTNCRAAGLFCEAGTCVPDSPCRGVICDLPPEDYCVGSQRYTFGLAGECADGVCGYEPAMYDCALEGLGCALGRCVDACFGDPCDRAPAPSCESTDTLRVWNPTGTCIDGDCEYASALLACDTPPDPFCDGQLRVDFETDGTCSAAGCRYARVYEDCPATPGGQCLDGACITVDPCDATTCDTPPPSRCEGNLELSYAPTGTCYLGICTYALEVEDCSARAGGSCVDGACVDPCEGVTCPPTGECFGNVSRFAAEEGVCVGGVCEYEWTDAPCNAVLGGTCVDGYCVDPCEGQTCEAPPASSCDGNTVRTWTTPGTCEAGTCRFVEVTVACDVLRGGTCVDGACVTECDGGCEEPPAPTCNGNLAYTYAAAGGCESGQCSYPLTVLDCSAVPGGTCVDGACVDPCAGVACNAPPADRCQDGLAYDYPAVGTCFAGDCRYDPVVSDCSGVLGGTCEAGVCVDPCAGITCNTPPAPVCAGGTLATYAPAGICELGTCSYTRVNVACDELLGGSCVDGACVTECDDGCASPPPGSCDGGVARRFAPTGSCVSGRCNYAEIFEDCAAVAGGECVGQGVCVNPCEGVSCEPPAPRCDGVFLVSVSDSGVCERGACRFDEAYEDCSAVPGGSCVAGACFDPCGGQLCDEPPLGYCDGESFLGYESLGECYAGECTYLQAPVVNCDDRYNGICAPTGCITECDLGCPDVPAPRCDVDELTTWTATGCDDGRCVFSPSTQNCRSLGDNYRCVEEGGAGACVDLCAGVVCPASDDPTTCEDFLYTYTADGVCTAGVCRYDRVVEACPGPSGDLCNGGRCVADPRCDGVVCDSPPPPTCTGDVGQGRIVYSAGQCRAGECVWTETFESCDARGLYCRDGVCQEEPPTCAGFACLAPPAPQCEGDALVGYREGVGVCVLEEGLPICDYSSLDDTIDCRASGRYCVNDACVVASTATAGAIVFTEIMADTTLPANEAQWVELHNTTEAVIALDGLTLRNPDAPSQSFALRGRIEPGDYFVVGRAEFAAEEEVPDLEWTGAWTMGAAAGAIQLVAGAQVIDSVRWGAGWPIRTGMSMSALGEVSAASNDLADNWCTGPELYSAAGRGTPGGPTQSCLLDAVTNAVEGELVFTEIMATPTVGGDWLEIDVLSRFHFDLAGLELVTPSGTSVLPSFVAAPGDAVAIGANLASGAGLVDVVVPGLELSPTSGTVRLRSPAGDLAVLTWDSTRWPTGSPARSAQVDDRFRSTSTIPDVWCASRSRYDAANFGTPSTPNDPCGGLRGFCVVDADCGPASYCDEGILISRVLATNCNELIGLCDVVPGDTIGEDCGASGLVCYDRECRDE